MMTGMPSDAPALRAVDQDLWIATDPTHILGMPLTATMTVVRLADGELLIHSPIALTEARRTAVTALGRVAHIYAPNTFHHRWAQAWADAFPDAMVHAPVGLLEKRPDLRVNRRHDAPLPAVLAPALEEVAVQGFLLEEAVLFHRASRTLIVADLVHNIGRPREWWTRLYAGSMGFYGRVAISRLIRWTAFNDKAAARGSLDEILALPIERIVVGHGAPVEHDARAALLNAYRWLRSDDFSLALHAPKRTGGCG